MEYLTRTTNVPCKEDYYSELTNTNIDDGTYSDIKTFWSMFKCRNLLDYSSYYVSLDVLLLAEVFMEFRKSILNWAGLDPDFYLGNDIFQISISTNFLHLRYKDGTSFPKSNFR